MPAAQACRAWLQKPAHTRHRHLHVEASKACKCRLQLPSLKVEALDTPTSQLQTSAEDCSCLVIRSNSGLSTCLQPHSLQTRPAPSAHADWQVSYHGFPVRPGQKFSVLLTVGLRHSRASAKLICPQAVSASCAVCCLAKVSWNNLHCTLSL